MAKSNSKYGVFALELIASLIYLAVTFIWASSLSASTYGQIWTPLLYGAAVVGSVVLFLASIGTLMARDEARFVRTVDKAVLVTGFSLVILTYTAALPFALAALALVLGIIGSGLSGAKR